jgi:hypothetical protein
MSIHPLDFEYHIAKWVNNGNVLIFHNPNIKECCLFVLFLFCFMLRSPKPQCPLLHFWYCWHYYKMWMQFSSPRSLDQWIHCFFTGPCSLQPMNSLKIQWNHLAYGDTFCYSVGKSLPTWWVGVHRGGIILFIPMVHESWNIKQVCHWKLNKIKTNLLGKLRCALDRNLSWVGFNGGDS